MLEQDTILYALTASQGVAHAKCVENPRTQSVLSDVILVLDIVGILAAMLILDAHPENVENGRAPIIKCAHGQIFASAQVLVLAPQLINLLEGNPLGPIDGLYQPHIFAHQARSTIKICHNLMFFEVYRAKIQ